MKNQRLRLVYRRFCEMRIMNPGFCFIILVFALSIQNVKAKDVPYKKNIANYGKKLPDSFIIITGICQNSTQESYCDILNETSTDTRAFRCNLKAPQNRNLIVTCINGVWTPPSEFCTPLCEKLITYASDVQCYHPNGIDRNCKGLLEPGTIVRWSCKDGYKPEYSKVVCNQKGKWDHSSVKCIPDCGRSEYNIKESAYKNSRKSRKFPWNAMVKHQMNNSISMFSGIIISPHLVLTTARCCQGNDFNVDQLEVVTGESNAYKVKTVVFPNNSRELEKDAEALIAVIELAEKTNLNVSHPVCVNWNEKPSLNLTRGDLGMVQYWYGRDSMGTNIKYNDLQMVLTKFKGREACLQQIPVEFQKYLTSNVFCTEPIPNVTPADQGASFVYQNKGTGLYYLGGFLDFTGLQEPSTNFTVMFKDIHQYIGWLKDYETLIDGQTELFQKRILNSYQVNKSTSSFCPIKKNELTIFQEVLQTLPNFVISIFILISALLLTIKMKYNIL